MDVQKWFMYSAMGLCAALFCGVISIGLINTERMKAEEKNSQVLPPQLKKKPQYSSASTNSVLDDSVKAPISSTTFETSTSVIKPVGKTEQGTPIFTNESFSETKRSPGDWNVYQKLKDTCNNWTNYYKKDGSELSRVNMNQSCRYAADYAQHELNMNPGPVNHASYKPKPKSQPQLTLIGSSNEVSSPQCKRWKREKEKVQNQLRAGYSEPRGNWLRERKRKLSELIYEKC